MKRDPEESSEWIPLSWPETIGNYLLYYAPLWIGYGVAIGWWYWVASWTQ